MIVAAGIICLSPNGNVLFLKRSEEGDNVGLWAFPGGKVEGDETLADAAARETLEETGYTVGYAGQFLMRSVSGDVDFTTFLKKVDSEFTPVLDEEHTAYVWMDPEEASTSLALHPGARVGLARMTMDELGIARAMASGDIASPMRYENILLVAMRVTGTGVSYRKALNEFVYRRPEYYLTPEFIARCNGLAVIAMHPEDAVLNSEEFNNRIVGNAFYTYIQGDEVWTIAKIYDEGTKELLERNQLSTSPSVVFRDPKENSTMILEDGSTLLIEGKPSLLDHLAICERGVWDKGQEPSGIRADSNGERKMATEEEDKARKDAEEKERADRAKADADMGEKLDKVLACVDSALSRMDAFEKRMDAEEEERKKEREDKARKDARKDGDPEPEDVAADKARKDEEEKEKKEREDKARKDAEEEEKKADKIRKDEDEKKRADSEETKKRIDALERKMPKIMSEEERSAMADTQARADSVYNNFGKAAPRPLDGEDHSAYRRRLVAGLQAHSPSWKDVSLSDLKGDAALAIAEKQIYADAEVAANHPTDLAEDELREVAIIDRTTGRRMNVFKGKHTFIQSLSQAPSRAILNLNPNNPHRD